MLLEISIYFMSIAPAQEDLHLLLEKESNVAGASWSMLLYFLDVKSLVYAPDLTSHI